MRRRRREEAAFSLFSFQDIITSVTGIVILITLVLILELIQRHVTSPAVQTKDISDQIRAALEDARQELTGLQGQIADEAAATSAAAAVSPTRAKKELFETGQQIKILEQQLTEAKASRAAGERQRKEWVKKSERRMADRTRLEQTKREAANLKSKLKKLSTSNRVIYNPSSESGKRAWIVDITSTRISVAPIGRRSIPVNFEMRGNDSRVRAFLSWAKGLQASSDYFVLILRPGGLAAFRRLKREIEQLGFDLGFDLVGADIEIIDPKSGAAF